MSKPVLQFLITLVGLSVPSALAADDAHKGWILERQDSLGQETMYVDARGVKLTYPSLGASLLCKPPAWDLMWFNTKSHKQYTETLAQFRARKELPLKVVAPPKLPESKTTYAGLPSRMVTVTEEPGKELTNVPLLANSKESWRVSHVESTYFFSEKLDLPIGALNFLNSFFGTPNYGGIPLGSNRKLSNGKVLSSFSTISAKRTVIPASIFASPAGYAHARNRTEIEYGGISSKMEDIARDMKVGEDFGK